MNRFLRLEKFSVGVGDRFAHQAKAQLQAFEKAAEAGVNLVPVWNKSNREHRIIGSEPASVRAAAVAAVLEMGWAGPYHIDADHIRLETVDWFVACSDFFTIDVAESIGKRPAPDHIQAFSFAHPELCQRLAIPGLESPLESGQAMVERLVAKYLQAVHDAGRIYRHIIGAKPPGTFITEVSMDETDAPQTPLELLVILAALADERVPVQTIAPKFTGRFNKGVDYVGSLAQFEQEFNDDLAVIAFAVKQYGLPDSLKLSVHSGSDKFSLYPIINRALRRTGAGLHLKTAGTTWLEELIGLAEAGGEGLELAKEIYAGALEHRDELCAPYVTVIDIDFSKLPSEQEVRGWTSAQFASAVRHQPNHPEFNPNMRQLLHVGYKIAAGLGTRYLRMLQSCESDISRNVTANLFERHFKPLFLD